MKVIRDGSSEAKYVPITENPLLTQKLRNYTPYCSVLCAILFFSFLVVAFIVLGIPMTIQANDVKLVTVDYTLIW